MKGICWSDVSSSCKNFIRNLMNVNVEKRFNSLQALNSKYLLNTDIKDNDIYFSNKTLLIKNSLQNLINHKVNYYLL